MKLCQVDHQMIFTGKTAAMTDMKSAIPHGFVYADEPKGEGIWQWQSTKWGKLSQKPVPPEPTVPSKMTKEELQKRYKDMGYWDALLEVIKDVKSVEAKPVELK